MLRPDRVATTHCRTGLRWLESARIWCVSLAMALCLAPPAYGQVEYTYEVVKAFDAASPRDVPLGAVIQASDGSSPSLEPMTRSTAEDTAFATSTNGPQTATLLPPMRRHALTFSLARAPRRGTLTALDTATGAFTYVLDAGFSGQDTFRFRVSDGVTSSQMATITVTMVP